MASSSSKEVLMAKGHAGALAALLDGFIKKLEDNEKRQEAVEALPDFLDDIERNHFAYLLPFYTKENFDYHVKKIFYMHSLLRHALRPTGHALTREQEGSIKERLSQMHVSARRIHSLLS